MMVFFPGHWLAAYDYAKFGPAVNGVVGRLLGPVLIAGALMFHFFAAQALGKVRSLLLVGSPAGI